MTDDATHRLLRFLNQAEPLPAVGDRRGRYRIDREIGRGGVAVVFEATDMDLDRKVALKVLTAATSERTRDEARAAARLQHPNVVTVHEVGEDFIAMELVRGRSLAAAWREAPRERRVQDVLTVARALGYAHGQGLVHRDVKPQNVLVETDTGRLVLSDFGLARMQDGKDSARAGRAAGTAPYMAPEQVRGDVEAMGRATDVWALGVMLFQAATGHLPFRADKQSAVFELILHARPAVIEGPLGAVIERALHKNPASRTRDAAVFADDLARALATATARRRRPLRLLVAGLLATAVLLPVGLAVNSRLARQAVIETLRNQARVSLEAALELQRAGANQRMRQFLPPLEAAYDEARRRAPELAEVEYLMGRMHRALLDDDRALARQSDALAKDAHFVPALYERAVLLTLRRERALALHDAAQEDGAAPAPRPDANGATVAWQQFLALGPGGNSASYPLLTPLARDVATAALAHLRGRPDEARRLLQAVLVADPLLDEAWEILRSATRADQTIAATAVDQELREREASHTIGLDRDRGYLPAYVGRAEVRLKLANRQRQRGVDPTSLLEGAKADVSTALELRPEENLWMLRGRLQLAEAYWLLDSGADPTPVSEAAEQDFTRALQLNSRLLTALTWRGTSHAQRAGWLEQAGRDGRAQYAAATRDWEAASRMDPKRDGPRFHLARAVGRSAYAEGRRGGEAAPLFAAAENDLSAFAARDRKPSVVRASASASIALDEARVLVARGEDPRSALDRAQARADQAIEIDRNDGNGWLQRGLVCLERADYLARGEKLAAARTEYALAATALAQAAALRPTLAARLAEPLARARQRSRTLP